MSLWKIAWRSMQQRSLSSLLTGLSMALGVALVVAVLVVYGVTRTHFMQAAQGYHLIVGAKGGKLQLVLNTVYHLSQPIENIPYSFYKEFTEGRFATSTRTAIPYCLGDSYLANGQTYRVVGTTPGMFEKIQFGVNRDGSPRKYAFAEGRNFESQAFFEAVIGSIVAARTGLGVGDSFEPSHGIVEEGDEPHTHDAFRIVGVLQPTGTPNDRALFVNIEGFYLLDGHSKEGSGHGHAEGEGDAHEGHEHDEDAHGDHGQDDHAHDEHKHAEQRHDEHAHADHKHDDHAHDDHHGHDHHGHDHHGHDHHDHGSHGHAHPREPLPESQREVTAVLVLLESDLVSQGVYTLVNEGQVAQAVYPAREVIQLFQRIVGPLQTLLLALTVMIVIVAGIGILVSIYNSMNDRQHEIAVMRALGAGRTTVMAVVLLESILLAVAGGVAGVLLGHGLLALASPYLVGQTGVAIHFLQFSPREFILIPALVVLAAVVGFLPALTAYRTDVAKALTANP